MTRTARLAGTLLRGGLLRLTGGLQARLLALLALALLPPIGVTLWQFDRAAATRIEVEAAAVADSVADLAAEHAGLVDAARTTLSVLAQLPAAAAFDTDCTAMFAAARAELPWAAVIGAATPAGIIRCASTPASLGVSISDRTYFRTVLETRGPAQSEVLFGRVNGRPIVVVALPALNPDRTVRAVLFVSIELAWLARQADRLSRAGTDLTLLLDPQGRVVASHPPAAVPLGQPVGTLPELAGLRAGATGRVRTAALDGVDRVVGFAPLPGGAGSTILVGRSEAAVLAPLRADARRAEALLLGAGLATALLAWWYGRAGLLRGLDAIVAATQDGRPLAAATPDALATREVQALHAALVADVDRRAAIERRWRTLGEAGATIVWRADPAGTLLEAMGWETLVGAPARTDGGLFCLATAHPEDRAAAVAAWGDALATGRTLAIEYRMALDGRASAGWRWMQARAVPVLDAAGAITEWVGTLHDIDDRRRGEAAIAEREARLRAVLTTAVDAVVVIDAMGAIREVNPAAERIFRRAAGTMLGADVGMLMPAALAPGHAGEVAAHAAGGPDRIIGHRREVTGRRGDGSLFPLEIAVARWEDAAGERFYTGILRDVSDRQAAAAALAESEQRFRLLAENAGDVITLADMEGVRRYVSPSARRVLGWEPEAMLGTSSLDLCHPDDVAWLRCAIDALRDGEAESSATYRLRRPDGSWLWVDGRARSHRDAAGRPVGYVASLRDATERRAAEQQLLDAYERMEAIAATDGLTGLANRRRFDEALRQEWRRAAREAQPLSLLMLDADRFKLFNDHYGHPAGDACLQAIAAVIDTVARRPADLCARIGGEEFALLMPATDAIGAFHVAERLRETMVARGLEHAGNAPSGVVTISIGVATGAPWAPGGPGPTTPTALMSLADRALYAAKAGGRNRVVEADALEPAAH